jgi:DNA (cytosine-5)-methyltransferase 1
MTLRMVDFFCGAGGSSQGAATVPGVEVMAAANHWARALESHAANFPDTTHYQGDIRDLDMSVLPRGDLFWASPECPTWSQARGVQRDYDRQPDLFGDTLPDEATERSRALMWDVPRYLGAMKLRGEPVLAGVVENVADVRQWDRWREWVASIADLGYRTKLIALNSMHARPRMTLLAPQSRDRLYLAYWLKSLGRDPDWDKWLRPQAWCPSCGQYVTALQVFKRAGNDMGRYRQQYLYRCPKVACRGQAVEPGALPAAAAIDWDHPGQRIGDRDKPLSPKTLARIRAGFERYARPITLQTGCSDRGPGSRTYPADAPVATQTATATQALAVPPVLVPAGGTWREEGQPVTDPMGTRTTRENDGIACPPFLTVHRGGPDEIRIGDVGDPLQGVTASGNHFGLVAPPFITVLRNNSPATSVTDPLGTVTTMGAHHGLTTPPFLVPLRSGRPRTIRAESDPLATIVADGANHGLVQPSGWVPLAMLMRNNTSRAGDGGEMCTPVTEPARTMTTKGHQSLVTWADILVPYYGTGVARDVAGPVGTLTARDRYALVSGAFDIEDALFRMLEPREIGRAMAFGGAYIVLGNKREKTRQFGNAVTPPVAEVIVSALVEAITGEALPLGADLGREAA